MDARTVTVDGQRIAYAEYGGDGPTVVLLHAMLMSHRFHRPLAEELASRGTHVIALDLLGTDEAGIYDPDRYTSRRLGEQVIGALDALGVERCVVLGTSIGSSVAMEAAQVDPDRVMGLVLEGPFLENGTGATAFLWSLLLATFTVGRPVFGVLAAALRRVPRGTHVLSDMLLDNLSQDPRRTTAFLRGLTFGRMGPPRRERATIAIPALVIGFPLDPFHPLSDAEAVAEELPNALLIRGRSIMDLRLAPDRLAWDVRRFVGDVWPRVGAEAVEAA